MSEPSPCPCLERSVSRVKKSKRQRTGLVFPWTFWNSPKSLNRLSCAVPGKNTLQGEPRIRAHSATCFSSSGYWRILPKSTDARDSSRDIMHAFSAIRTDRSICCAASIRARISLIFCSAFLRRRSRLPACRSGDWRKRMSARSLPRSDCRTPIRRTVRTSVSRRRTDRPSGECSRRNSEHLP